MENDNKSASELDREIQKEMTDKQLEQCILDNGQEILKIVEEETGEDQETRLKRLARQSIEEKRVKL